MSHQKMLAVLTAAAIAAGAIAATTGDAFAAAPAKPHYKPLICIFIPFDFCTPKPAPMKVHHHHKMLMKAAPKPK